MILKIKQIQNNLSFHSAVLHLLKDGKFQILILYGVKAIKISVFLDLLTAQAQYKFSFLVDLIVQTLFALLLPNFLFFLFGPRLCLLILYFSVSALLFRQFLRLIDLRISFSRLLLSGDLVWFG